MLQDHSNVGELPVNSRKQSLVNGIKKRANRTYKKFTTKQGLIGDYDYKFLITPNLPFMKRATQSSPFFGVYDEMPVFLGMILGLSHTLAIIIGVSTPPIIMADVANLSNEQKQYMVACSLIVSGFLSIVQISRTKVPKTRYYIGTGLLSIVGTSFATITIATTGIPQMYKNGFCPLDDDGNQLPCPQAFEAILGTSACCALLESLASFIPPKILQRMFPPLVTGPVVLLIGTSLITSGMTDWAGGSDCSGRPTSGPFQLCPNNDAPHALPWGSPEFIGLGFSVFVAIVLCERFGSPIMRSSGVILGLLVGCIIAIPTGYFDRSAIDTAPGITFLWTHAFGFKVYAPIVLPMLAVYIVCIMEAIGNITACCDVSRMELEGEDYESRVQGGLLADGLNSVVSALCNNPPLSTFAQNNGVIAMSKCANRSAGLWGCFFLVLCGILGKVSGALVSIPKPVLGGLTTFLFSSVAVSGLSIISKVEFTNRNRFILTCSCMFGLAATLVPNWFSFVFSYEGDNSGLRGFLDAIELVCTTGFALAGFVGVLMNLILQEEKFELYQAEDTVSIASDHPSVQKVELEGPKEHEQNGQ